MAKIGHSSLLDMASFGFKNTWNILCQNITRTHTLHFRHTTGNGFTHITFKHFI